ncbi:MmcQ/YjbR family DNA-binding protein [Paenibacillus silviterrae]|uniref:MmcQ/YjbR family DNA-binding protein n=1 Tax=Paenibacillus silviterrae TaxID=3242194 RepID=UPI002543D4A8|nr:MmcQ/YjbR family DNA-binding protein [Paenibacillus chinjuensis]
MNQEQVKQAGLGKTGAALGYPFGPEPAVLFVEGKMFALLGGYQGKPSVSLKTDPDTAWIVRDKYPDAVFPGYHLNKRHWNSVVLDGSVPKEELLDMLEESYRLVVAKLPKAVRERLRAQEGA